MNETTATERTTRSRTGVGAAGLALAFVAAVLLLPAGEAEAHGLDRVHAPGYAHGHRRHVDHRHFHFRDRHYRDRHFGVVLPRWLRHDRGFRRWYALNHFRFASHASWRRLHRHYLRDHRYHRSLRRAHRHAHRDDRPRRRGRGD